MSNTLFGAEDAPLAGKKSRKAAPAAYDRPVAAESLLRPPVAHIDPEFVGRCDSGFVCGDARCAATVGDVVVDDGWQWLVACSFCGTGRWVTAPKNASRSSGNEFAFRSGQHAGSTIAEVLAVSGGRRYLEWCRDNHPSGFVRDAVKSGLDAAGSDG